ncbi:hypothetical protein PCI56_26160 [Plesiomonas shigelloides subsp. oncorhynchi]|nr:hypothetical protein [Plesiomonas shigelloides]
MRYLIKRNELSTTISELVDMPIAAKYGGSMPLIASGKITKL